MKQFADLKKIRALCGHITLVMRLQNIWLSWQYRFRIVSIP